MAPALMSVQLGMESAHLLETDRGKNVLVDACSLRFHPLPYLLVRYACRSLAVQGKKEGIQMQQPERRDADMPPNEATAQETPPSLEGQLAEAQQQQQAYLDALRRAQADFINYKRRAAQERAEACIAAQAEMLEMLLPVLDDLGHALESAPADLAEQPWVQGIHLVARRLTQTLQQLGIQQIGAPGEAFDPRWHEAVMTERRADLPAGTVAQVTRPGYVFGERVLRPAQVVVAAPEAAAVAPSEE